MTDTFTPLMRALVAASLLLATATLMLVTVNSARVRAAGALAIGKCGAFGEAFDFHSPGEARKSALAKCTADECRVVTTVQHGCAALAVDYADGCGARGWGQASDLGQAQNAALKSCYREGAKDCVIRTFFCDGKG
jgi:hypothetical protein